MLQNKSRILAVTCGTLTGAGVVAVLSIVVPAMSVELMITITALISATVTADVASRLANANRAEATSSET